jgi:hypothetical protein
MIPFNPVIFYVSFHYTPLLTNYIDLAPNIIVTTLLFDLIAHVQFYYRFNLRVCDHIVVCMPMLLLNRKVN